MNKDNESAGQMAQKRRALANSMPLSGYEPDLYYGTKEFTRKPKSGLKARPNHLGDKLHEDLPGGF